MTGDLALGIDVGTSGIRCAVLDRDGRDSGFSEATLGECGANHRAPLVWRDALALAMARLWQAVEPGRIGAVAVDGTSGTVLGLDAAGEPVGDALMYNDAVDRADILEPIASAAPRESAAHGASSALARACVLQDRPGVTRIAHQADWIAEQLSGKPMPSDESNALKTGYDPVARNWPGWMTQTPIRRALLPEVVAVGTVTGRTVAVFGLPEGAALISGATDGCASFLATGAAEPGDGVTALGTTLTIKLISDSPVFAPEFGIYSHRIGDLWLAGGASNSGGGALAAHFTTDEIVSLSARIDPLRDSRLDYYPLTAPGERFPVNDPTLQPHLDPRPEDDAEFLHGLLEGIARIEALGYRRLAELGAPPLRRLRSVGSGARNEVWTTMRRRILGVETASSRSEAAAAGIATLALACLRGAA